MSAVGLQFGPPQITTNPVNALDLSAKMGISLETLARAAHADNTANGAHAWQPGLRTVADLWDDLTATFGGEENAKAFLACRRPELMDETPVHFLDIGEPEVVQNLVHAIKEMLP